MATDLAITFPAPAMAVAMEWSGGFWADNIAGLKSLGTSPLMFALLLIGLWRIREVAREAAMPPEESRAPCTGAAPSKQAGGRRRG